MPLSPSSSLRVTAPPESCSVSVPTRLGDSAYVPVPALRITVPVVATVVSAPLMVAPAMVAGVERVVTALRPNTAG